MATPLFLFVPTLHYILVITTWTLEEKKNGFINL